MLRVLFGSRAYSWVSLLLGGMLTVVASGVGGNAEEPKTAITPDLVYGHKDGLAMTMDHFKPTANANGAAVLFMVSGGWVSVWTPPEQLQPMFQPLLDKGFNVFAVRHGSSPRYVVPEAVSDVRKALGYVSENANKLGIDRDRIGVFGFSAGGHLSLILGTTTNQVGSSDSDPRVAAVVAVFPPSDLTPYIDNAKLREQFPALKFDRKELNNCSPLFHATMDDAPTLMIHGDKDELVPLFHSEKMDEALKGVNVPSEVVVIKGAAHGFDAEGQKVAYQSMIDWFEKYLTSDSEPVTQN